MRHCCKIGDSYNLLVIEDGNEYEFIKDKIQAHFGHNGRSLWIGLKETASRRTFEWVDGSSLSYGSTFYRYPWAVYSHWDKEPNSVIKSTFLTQIIFFFHFLHTIFRL